MKTRGTGPAVGSGGVTGTSMRGTPVHNVPGRHTQAHRYVEHGAVDYISGRPEPQASPPITAKTRQRARAPRRRRAPVARPQAAENGDSDGDPPSSGPGRIIGLLSGWRRLTPEAIDAGIVLIWKLVDAGEISWAEAAWEDTMLRRFQREARR
jgi:hypothetical protein